MKNFTTRVVVLLISFITVLSSLNAAEKRYVFVLGGFPKTDPGWGAGWVDYRTDDLNRILYIWPSSNSLLVTPLVGTGSLGQQDYTAFSISNLGWWGCGYYVGPDTGNATASIDLTDVTSSWYFHFAIRTTCATDITLSLYGSTLDPTDPFLNTNTKGTVVLNSTILPLSKRDGIQWVNFSIPMSQLMSGSVVATNNLMYLAPVKKYNYVTFSGGNDTGKFVAWDNVYIGNTLNNDTQAPTVPTGLLNTSPTTNSFTLIWSPSTDNVGVTGYDVYKNGILYGTTTSTNLTINNLAANTAYTMTVLAKDASGNMSVASLPLVVTTARLETEPPSVPTGLMTTTPTTNSFTLIWNPSTDNVGVTGYDVYKDGVFYASSTNTFLAISGLNAETSYSMTVKAKDAAGNVSAASLPLLVTTAFPDTYSITVQIGANGIVKENNVSLINAAVLTVNRNSIKTFTITSNPGYEVATLTYNGKDVKSQLVNNQFSTPNAIVNATLSVTFQKIQYRLSLKSAESGTMNLLCEYGATQSFDFTPSVGWKVNMVLYNGIDVTNSLINGVYNVPAITGNALLNVSFVSNSITGASEVINNFVKVYSTPTEIVVEGTSKGEIVVIYTSNGTLLQSIKSHGERLLIPAQGDAVYLVKTASKTVKVIL